MRRRCMHENLLRRWVSLPFKWFDSINLWCELFHPFQQLSHCCPFLKFHQNQMLEISHIVLNGWFSLFYFFTRLNAFIRTLSLPFQSCCFGPLWKISHETSLQILQQDLPKNILKSHNSPLNRAQWAKIRPHVPRDWQSGKPTNEALSKRTMGSSLCEIQISMNISLKVSYSIAFSGNNSVFLCSCYWWLLNDHDMPANNHLVKMFAENSKGC